LTTDRALEYTGVQISQMKQGKKAVLGEMEEDAGHFAE
jgi:hypothetical protein